MTMRYYLSDSCVRLAAAVFVTLACYGILINAQPASNESDKTVVNVDVYYEALCRDSRDFIVNQLVPSYPELKQHLRITFIPYGKAMHTRESATSPWQFQCQHGRAECRGNKAQACAINAIQSSEAAQNQQQLTVNLVGCAMAQAFKNSALPFPQCAQEVGLSEETQNSITTCIDNSFGDDLLATNGDKTVALEPSLKFVPTIIINGEYSQENQNQALQNFAGLICRQLTEGEKPNLCQVN